MVHCVLAVFVLDVCLSICSVCLLLFAHMSRHVVQKRLIVLYCHYRQLPFRAKRVQKGPELCLVLCLISKR